MESVLNPAYTEAIRAAPPAPSPLPRVSGFARTLGPLLSATECRVMIEIAEGTGFGKASLYTDGGGQEYFSDTRKSKRTMVDSRAFVDEFWKRIEHAIPTEWKGRPLHIKEGATSPLNERLRILKYDRQGDEFRPHADGQYVSPDGGISQLTILIYLNEGYLGAYTQFLADDQKTWVAITPTAGGVTIQDQALVHAVPPLMRGVKYVVRTEVMYGRPPPHPAVKVIYTNKTS